MNRYAGHDIVDKKPSKFLARFASIKEDKESFNEINEKDQFNKNYKVGRLSIASANKYMSLRTCGLDRFIEANTNIVWAKEGDNIVRLDNDLEWVNQFLEQEGNQ